MAANLADNSPKSPNKQAEYSERVDEKRGKCLTAQGDILVHPNVKKAGQRSKSGSPMVFGGFPLVGTHATTRYDVVLSMT